MAGNTFECSHCGFCCIDDSMQINLSLLDIKNLKESMNMSLLELFEKGIVSFIPFIRTEDFSIYDVELGLKRPCPLYGEGRCEAYDKRPMNCRTFPLWLINHKIPDDTLNCIKDVNPDMITSLRYKEYERMIGEILIKDSRITEDFMKEIKATQKIDLTDDKNYIKLKKLFEKAKGHKSEKRFSKKMIKLAEERINKSLYSKIPLIEKKIKNTDFSKDEESLEIAEAIIDGIVTNVNFFKDCQNP